MKSNRLFKMAYLLMSNDKLSAKELADKLEVSVRSVYRYMENLSEAGIPIYASQGRNGGISLLPQFRMNSALVSEKEQNDILASLQSFASIEQSDQDTLDKLSAVFQKKPISWIEIDPSTWSNSREQKSTLAIIKQAIFQSQMLTFDYLNSKNEQLAREVYPYQVVFKDRAWYLKGYSIEREDWRLFKLTRMHNVTIDTSTSPNTTLVPKQQQFESTTNKVDLILKVDTQLSYRIFEEFSKEDIYPTDDDHYLVTCSISDGEWLDSYLLSFGAHLQVIAPTAVQLRLKQKLQKMLANYQT